MKKRILGIIGGSGLYSIEGLENIKWKQVSTNWGDPSDKILSATLSRQEIYFFSSTAEKIEKAIVFADLAYLVASLVSFLISSNTKEVYSNLETISFSLFLVS